jgi:hypothetical protein
MTEDRPNRSCSLTRPQRAQMKRGLPGSSSSPTWLTQSCPPSEQATWLHRRLLHGAAMSVPAGERSLSGSCMLGLSLTLLGLGDFQLGGWVCGGSTQIEVQPGSRHRTHLCPLWLARPPGHSAQVRQPTVIRPGPHGCPFLHWVG